MSVRTIERNLAATEAQCTWDAVSGVCTLNPDYITTLGTPVTDSQKLLARGVALTSYCSQLNQTACAADANCLYNNSTRECGITDTYVNDQWLRGPVYCPGSAADLGQVCTSHATQAACTANPNCNWNAAPEYISVASTILSVVNSWPLPSSSSAFTGACTPKWATDATSLASILANAVNATLATAWNAATSRLALFTGVCPGAIRYLNLNTLCSLGAGRVPCVSTPGCSWGDVGCQLAPDFAVQLLVNASDPWVQSYRQAVSACGVLTTSAACAGLAAITADPAKLAAYTALQYTFPVVESNFTVTYNGTANTTGNGTNSGTTVAPSSSLLVSLVAGVACLWALLL